MQEIKRYEPSIQNGLREEQVAERLSHHLHNEQIDSITKSYRDIFRDNICTLFNLINAILAGLLIYVGSYRNLLFLGVAISNLAIGIFQEIRAKRLLDRLSILNESSIRVIREGKEQEVALDQVVLDDIMVLSSGAQICSDAILREGKLEVNESNVNGESDVIVKTPGDFLYSGSYILSGNAYAQVIHVGERNYATSIMKDAKVLKKHKSELRDSINFIIKYIGIAIIPIGILLFLKQYYLLEYTFAEAIVPTVSALIGMIPEGLVLLTSVALAVGSINLAKQNTLVRELYCIETLARVDTLCLDKTGTITKGCMQVETILHMADHNVEGILAAMMSALKDDNSTAQALRNYVHKEITDPKALACIPFSSERKYSAVSFAQGTYVLGAYEYITSQRDAMVEEQLIHYAKQGNRVVTLCYSTSLIEHDEIPQDVTAIALIVLSDPIREEAPKTLAYFASQGVDIKIISGDNPLTVHEIARKAGVLHADAYIDASTLNEEELPQAVKDYTIFGRVSPQQKKLLLRSLKQQGHTTAMIGDGVNDVLALKEADCSIAVAQGSEAAKNIANLVLLDNNFKHMPYIVTEGRRVINNIQRAASLFLVKTIFSLLLSILTLFLNSRYPFIPIQLTLISSLTIGIPSFFLALEPNHNRLKGNFVINVLSQALPGALTVVVYILFISLFTKCFGYHDDVRSTMCVILTGVCSLTVLQRVCIPFSKQRRVIFLTMCILFILAIVCCKQVFMITTLDWLCLLVSIAGIICVPLFMTCMYHLLARFGSIRKKIIHATKQSEKN